eukprot:SAG31_NODE_135_length_23206_cov_25.707967_30_plen_90_part_00
MIRSVRLWSAVGVLLLGHVLGARRAAAAAAQLSCSRGGASAPRGGAGSQLPGAGTGTAVPERRSRGTKAKKVYFKIALPRSAAYAAVRT